MKCADEKDFASAVKSNQDEIIVEGDLAKHIIRIKAVGKVSWAVAIASISASVAFAIAAVATLPAPPLSGIHAFAFVPVATPAVGVLGSAAASAIAIGVCAGGVGVLNLLRDKYDIVEKHKDYLVLRRRKRKHGGHR